jgi:hypothetical protein
MKHPVESLKKVGVHAVNLPPVLNFADDPIRKLDQITDSPAALHKTMLCVRYDERQELFYRIPFFQIISEWSTRSIFRGNRTHHAYRRSRINEQQKTPSKWQEKHQQTVTSYECQRNLDNQGQPFQNRYCNSVIFSNSFTNPSPFPYKITYRMCLSSINFQNILVSRAFKAPNYLKFNKNSCKKSTLM